MSILSFKKIFDTEILSSPLFGLAVDSQSLICAPGVFPLTLIIVFYQYLEKCLISLCQSAIETFEAAELQILEVQAMHQS